MDGFAGSLGDKKTAQAGLEGLKGLVDGAKDKKTVIDMFEFMDKIIECVADKQKPVQKAAEDLLRGEEEDTNRIGRKR
jgi:hypothetical protein